MLYSKIFKHKNSKWAANNFFKVLGADHVRIFLSDQHHCPTQPVDRHDESQLPDDFGKLGKSAQPTVTRRLQALRNIALLKKPMVFWLGIKSKLECC